MNNKLSYYSIGRNNNFNLLRFLVASLVIFSHSFPLAKGGGDPLNATFGVSGGTIAVDIFFITSGFLITSSFFARNNLLAFIWARFIRIYPALIIAILFTVFVVGLSFTTLSPSEFISNNQTHKYLIKGISLIKGVEHTLPGVFVDNTYKNAVNGSLWTLPYEIKMYGILAAILSCLSLINRFLNKQYKNSLLLKKFDIYKWILLFISVISLTIHFINHFNVLTNPHFVRLFSMFFVGASFYAWRDKIHLTSSMIFIFMFLLLFSSFNKNSFFFTYYLTIPYITLYLAYVPSGIIRKFNSYGDYSYGIYIYAFPIQQSLAHIMPNISVFQMSILALLISFIMAIFSWHLVEKRCLKFKDSYVIFEKLYKKS